MLDVLGLFGVKNDAHGPAALSRLGLARNFGVQNALDRFQTFDIVRQLRVNLFGQTLLVRRLKVDKSMA